jgi:biopolymer transport protein ExbB/TolQ
VERRIRNETWSEDRLKLINFAGCTDSKGITKKGLGGCSVTAATTNQSSAGRFIDGSVSLAVLLIVAFYGLMSWEGMDGSLIHKYTTEHATEYVIVAMLAWGFADLLLRCLGFRTELRALKQQSWLPPRQGPEPAARASDFYAAVQSLPKWMQASRLGKRLQLALVYVHEKRSADGFDDHLRDISERDALQTHAHYGVPRFVVWITPVLGFLGTVVHFGTALGSLSPDDLAKNLPIVVAGMGTAFDTTTMALASSVAIMLGMFLVERVEVGIVHEIDGWIERNLSNRFAVEDAELGPFLRAIEAANRATLATVQESWSRLIAHQHERDEAHEQHREERLKKLLDGFANQRVEHQSRLQLTVDQIDAVQKNLAQFTQMLSGVLAGEHQLLGLQKSLAENLRVLQQTQQFDQAVNGLTAAIHLLTVRQHSMPATHSKAA